MSTRHLTLRRSRRVLVGFALIPVLVLAACTSANQVGKKTKNGLQTVRLTNTKYAAELLPITAGMQRGIFKAHGIDLQISTVKSSDIASSALISHRADVAFMQQAFVVSAAAAGAPLVMVGNVLDQLDYHLIVGKGINSVSDLVGKKFGDPGPNNGNTAVMRYIMDKSGLGQKNLQYVTVGVQSAILAGIRSGQVQAGLLVAPFDIQARKMGLRDLGSVAKYLPDASAAVIAATSSTVKGSPGVIKKFLAALVESNAWVADNPASAIDLLAKDAKMTAADAKDSYAEVAGTYAKDGRMSTAALQEWINIALKYGVMTKSVKPSDVYDPSFLPGA